MAGDWVKMRSGLLANPKVHAIAKAIGRDPAAAPALTTGFSGPPGEVLSRNALRNVTVTALLCVWSAANEHSDDGKLACCDLDDLDEIAGIPGFGVAMEAVGWAVRNEAKNHVLLPNFSEHNTTAKDRTGAERQRRFRQNRNGDVTPLRNALRVTQRRGEKSIPPPPPVDASQGDEKAPPAAPPPAGEPVALLLDAWKAAAAAGHAKAHRSRQLPDKLPDRLSEAGWLDDALAAIQHLPKCRYFKTPVTLHQLCNEGFAAKVVNGDFDEVTPAKVRPALRGIDDPPPPRGFQGDDLARFEAAKAKALRDLQEAS